MSKRACRISALSVIITGVLICLSSCGSAGGDGVVVRVGEHSISEAAIDHWARIEDVLAYAVIPRHPVPRGVIPDPPSYTACISFLAGFARTTVEGQHELTTARLKNECRKHDEEMHRRMVDFLITFYWTSGELADRGIKITDSEIKHQFQRFVHREFSTPAEFRKYLAYTGMSVSDLSLIMNHTLLDDKLLQIAPKPETGQTPQQRHQREQEFIKFNETYQKKWTARTNCRTGFVVEYCKQYRGNQTTLSS